MRMFGAPVAWRARRLGPELPRPDRHAGDRSARPAPGHESRATPTASLAAIITSHEIRSAADFRKRVPIGGYDRHEPYIDRVRRGETSALFGPGTDVLMFAMTSGTTNRPKTIPVTREALDDYREGWTIWGILAFDAHPRNARTTVCGRSCRSPAIGASRSPRRAFPAARSPD